MRRIGYTRIISLDSFKKPNFQLVAEILDWLAQRFDHKADIPEDLNTSRNRVEFMNKVCELLTTKARIQISPYNLYMADYHAVPELMKIASLLYSVYLNDDSNESYSSKFSESQTTTARVLCTYF